MYHRSNKLLREGLISKVLTAQDFVYKKTAQSVVPQ